jgi:[ribosomal protein S5]-alanine N-acetyltransferase
MQLQGEKCLLRPLRSGDESSLARHGNDREIWLNMRDRFPHPYTEESGRTFIGYASQQEPQTIFGIEIEGEVIGVISLIPGYDIERVSCEMGYWLGKQYWGRGIVVDAIRTLTRHAFDALGMHRVFAIPFVHNKGSCRALEKAGFQLEGTLRRSAVKDGKVQDQYLYAAYDDTWPGRSGGRDSL